MKTRLLFIIYNLFNYIKAREDIFFFTFTYISFFFFLFSSLHERQRCWKHGVKVFFSSSLEIVPPFHRLSPHCPQGSLPNLSLHVWQYWGLPPVLFYPSFLTAQMINSTYHPEKPLNSGRLLSFLVHPSFPHSSITSILYILTLPQLHYGSPTHVMQRILSSINYNLHCLPFEKK